MLAESPKATLSIEGFSSFVASTAASIATGWNEPVPGRDSHPLKSSAFHGARYRHLSEIASVLKDRLTLPTLLEIGIFRQLSAYRRNLRYGMTRSTTRNGTETWDLFDWWSCYKRIVVQEYLVLRLLRGLGLGAGQDLVPVVELHHRRG
jgi:hypothetical protein